jgi:hypothetical protein
MSRRPFPLLERWLDVCHQYRWRLIASLILVPIVLAAASHLVDRSQLVQARLWVNSPVLLLNSTLDPASTGTPAPTAAALMREQLSTDAFVDRVLSTGGAGFAANPERQPDRRRDFRASVAIASDNNAVLTLTYRTDRPAYGIAVLKSLITEFESRALTSVLAQVSAPGPTGEAALATARSAVEQSLRQLEDPPAPLSAELAHLYLADQVRLTEANATAKAYLALLTPGDQNTVTSGMTSLLEQGMFALLDPPSVRPAAMTSTPLASWVWLGLAGVAVLALVLTGRECLRDGRVRSGADVQRRTGLPYLGSTPAIDQGPA